jgi:oxalate---CoA ligase
MIRPGVRDRRDHLMDEPIHIEGRVVMLAVPDDRLPLITDVLAGQAATRPDSPALVALPGDVLTYGDLLRQAAVLRQDLRALGISPHDRVAFTAVPHPRTVTLLISLLCGCVAVPVHPHYTEAELAEWLPRLRLAAILSGGDGPLAATARTIGVPAIPPVPDSGPFRLRLGGEPVGPPVDDEQAARGSLAYILSTSGTTGRAKLVPASHGNMACAIARQMHMLDIFPGDRTILLASLAHAAGIQQVARALWSGGSILCPDTPDLDSLPEWTGRFDPTWLGLAPALMPMLANRLGGRPNPSLRFIRSGTADLPETLRDEVERGLGVAIYNTLGASEAPTIAGEGPRLPHRPGTVGVPVCEVRIVDDAGQPLAEGEAGDLMVAGGTVVGGYWDDPEATARAFTADGWFRTGDRALVQDGYLTMLGRADDTINVAGRKVDPLEVDRVLAGHPGVAEAAAFRGPSAASGWHVQAAVVPKPGEQVTPRELRRWLLERLAPHKVPTTITFVDTLPKTANGKIARRELARYVAGDAGS